MIPKQAQENAAAANVNIIEEDKKEEVEEENKVDHIGNKHT